MTNKIEQIIIDAMDAPAGGSHVSIQSPAWLTDRILAALDAAGLAVLPKECTKQQLDDFDEGPGPSDYATDGMITGAYDGCAAAFDPAKFEPEAGE